MDSKKQDPFFDSVCWGAQDPDPDAPFAQPDLARIYKSKEFHNVQSSGSGRGVQRANL